MIVVLIEKHICLRSGDTISIIYGQVPKLGTLLHSIEEDTSCYIKKKEGEIKIVERKDLLY